MPQPQTSSSIQTGALTLSAASLVPIIDWGASRLGVAIPVDAQLQLAALAITVGHAIYNHWHARVAGAAPQTAVPMTTPAGGYQPAASVAVVAAPPPAPAPPPAQ
ncbi:hypothetical protein ACVCH0_20555 [Burkholderia glumae]|uniref:hypothetical protein n=1 Tax=Burkholderia glumae TaxID=337 RepID=UPI00039A70B9|nr:hypothetical protein [Burkholderia glumae]MCM2544244.1 hypothetical protein [Burkholderia glumae]